MIAGRALAIGLLLATLAAVPAGCAASLRANQPDVTGGRRLEMFVSSPERRFERYRVGIDGVLHWAGGVNAQSAKFTWSGPLTSDEIERLFGAIERDGWLERDPPSNDEPPGTIYNVQFRASQDRTSFTVTGDSAGLVEVHQILATASRRRLDSYLEALPQPGEQRP